MQSDIIKNTVQRKNPIVQRKINQVSKQGRNRSRVSTYDKLAAVSSPIQSPDPQNSAEYEAGIQQSSLNQINQFGKHVEILEEQYIDEEMVVPVMLQRKCPTVQVVHGEQWRSTRCCTPTKLTTVHVNRQIPLPRTGTAQLQDPGDVSCDVTQNPLILKMQKTAEIQQVQVIDKVVGISEITQSKDICQSSRWHGNSRKFEDGIVYVPVTLKRRCQARG